MPTVRAASDRAGPRRETKTTGAGAMIGRNVLVGTILWLGAAARVGLAASPPVAGPVAILAMGIDGPEGITVDRSGGVIVGETNGDVVRITADGVVHPYASTGERLAGLAPLRDGRVLAAAFDTGRVWSIPPGGGTATVLATVVGTPNGIVGTRRGKIFVSVSDAGQIVEIASGTPVVAASGLTFPNGLAVGPDRYLYVAETFVHRVSRLPLSNDGTLGPAEVYATGVALADGVAFDAHGDLLVAGSDSIQRVKRGTRAVSVLSTDPLLFWPSSLVFGRGRGLSRRDVFCVNYGLPLGSGTTLAFFRYSRPGARVVR